MINVELKLNETVEIDWKGKFNLGGLFNLQMVGEKTQTENF